MNSSTSLERAHERRQNIEGHNLDQDFSAVAPQPPMGARVQTSVPLAGVGCATLADHLRVVTWRPKFRPHLSKKYDGTSNPLEFLQAYVTAITAAGGNTAVMVSYFHVALTGPARTWLMNLTPGSIYSWEELCAWFTANFASAYQRHGVEAHLHAVRQEPGETLRAFISCFTKVWGTIPHISDASIITAFRQGVRDEKMLEKLATHDVENVTSLRSGRQMCQGCRGPCMALNTTSRGCPDGRLGCRCSGQRQEKEEKPRSREAVVRCSGRRSCGWEPRCAWQASMTAGWRQWIVPYPSNQSPQHLGVPRDPEARKAHQRAARVHLQVWLTTPMPPWQGEGLRRQRSRGRAGPRVSVSRASPEGHPHRRL
jgi:hypothetical protein